METILDDIRKGLALAAQLADLVAVIEANYALAKNALSLDDDRAVMALIDQLHAQTNNNTVALLAMRDPDPVATDDTKPKGK